MDEINWTLTLLVFFARILDVSLGTLRIIYINKDKRLLAPLLGFIEVFIWIVMVSQLVRSVSSLPGYLAYAAGFAAGNWIGMLIESRLAFGTLIVRAIIPDGCSSLTATLEQAGFGVTFFDAQGATGPVQVVFTVIHRKELQAVVNIIHACHPSAFYTVEEARAASRGVFHPPAASHPFRYLGLRGKG